MAPWEPTRADDYFSRAGQESLITDSLHALDEGRLLPHVITAASGEIIGRITLSGIEHRAFQSGRLGYWVSQDHQGRGVATAAIGELVSLAFHALGLHRVEAGTLPHNHASRRALDRNGFVHFGTAPAYLRIAGRWQDHLLFQRLAQPTPTGADQAPPGVSLATVSVLVRDQDEAIAFYSSVLGLRVVADQPAGSTGRFVVLGANKMGAVEPGAGLQLVRAETPAEHELVGRQTAGRVGFFLCTSDFAVQHRRMLAAGVVFHQEPRREPYGTVAVFSDLYGNRWDLIEPS